MTPYIMIIVGSGVHHQGHHTGNPSKDADHHLKGLVAALQGCGQTVKAATFQAENSPVEILVGKAEDLPKFVGHDDDDEEATDLSRFNEVLRLLQRIDENSTNTLLEFRDFVEYEKKDDAPKPRKPRAKKEGAGGGGDDEKLLPGSGGDSTAGTTGDNVLTETPGTTGGGGTGSTSTTTEAPEKTEGVGAETTNTQPVKPGEETPATPEA